MGEVHDAIMNKIILIPTYSHQLEMIAFFVDNDLITLFQGITQVNRSDNTDVPSAII